MRRNMLNNYTMQNRRKDPMYATVITDLALTGLIDKDKAEKLLGYSIPECLKLPSWYASAASAASNASAASAASAASDTSDTSDTSDASDTDEKTIE